MSLGIRLGDRVYFFNDPDYPEHPEIWGTYHPMAWWVGASNGLDMWFCRMTAWEDSGRLLIQHGENPEAVRWFTLDELNRVDRRAKDDPVDAWCREIHGDEPMPELPWEPGDETWRKWPS